MSMRRRMLAAFVAIFWIIGLAGAAWSEDSASININTASVEELAKLKRVGMKYAAKIVEYRTQNGPFQKPEDITRVQGIGAKTYEVNKDNIITE